MHNFDLSAGFAPNGQLQLHVLHSPAGELRHAHPAPIVTGVGARFQHAALARSNWKELQALGGELRRILLPDPIWALWRESLGRAGDAGLRLRIRPGDPRTAALPWELLYDGERGEFLALNPATPLVRYLEGPIPLASGPPPAPLELLLASATPTDADPLEVLQELDRIAQALASAPLRIHQQPHMQAAQLRARLLDQRPQVVHFAGHATWDPDRKQGQLILEDEKGKSDPLADHILATLLRQGGVRLVVLNACESGVAGQEPWSGLAQALVQAGIPGVVAMATTIPDQAALAFAQAFYTALAQSLPVDQAVVHGRQAILAHSRAPSQAGAWLAPVLFLRSPDGRLWAQPPAAQPQAERGEQAQAGGISIGTLKATNVVFRNQEVDLRGAAIHLSQPEDPRVLAKLDDLLAGQEELKAGQGQIQADLHRIHQALLARFDEQEQRLVAAFVARLDAQQTTAVQEVLTALEQGVLAPSSLMDLLAEVELALAELQGQVDELSQPLAQLQSVVHAPELDVQHKLKVTFPLIPWILSYEGEVALGSRADLEQAWQRLVGRVRGR